MADVLTKKQRQYNMSQIRSKNTSPEVALRRILYSAGVRGYRLHYDLPGKPDIVFARKKMAVFVDGCFWHKCPKCFVVPQTRQKFWMEKIGKNVKRDAIVNKTLKRLGWTVLRFWEHEVRTSPGKCCKKIMRKLAVSA